jgi:RluA family pseudouridine synthase
VKAPRPEPLPATILDEGAHYAVFDKPAGITVVAARGVSVPTLLDVAVARFGQGVRPVHRLDKPTTGCCVLAKSPFGQQALSDAFRRHLVDKRYLAVITGAPPWSKLAIDARLLRVDMPEAKRGPLAVQTVDERGQRALTRVRVLARGEALSLVEARLETGRMHQIRAHLAHVGFPLWGDPLYSEAPKGSELSLHAWAISFPVPGGGRRFVVAAPPAAFIARLAAAGVDVMPLFEAEKESFFKPLAAMKTTGKATGKTADRRPSRKGPRPEKRGKPTRGRR